MKSDKKIILSLFTVVTILLTGCASVYEKPPENAYYGPSPQNYEESIKEYFSLILKDADSAKYDIGWPEKGYLNQGLAYGGGVAWYGWMVKLHINAKNSYGAYTGYEPYVAFFKSNFVVDHIEGFDSAHLHSVLHPEK